MTNRFEQFEWTDAVMRDCRHLVRLAIYEDLNRARDWTTVTLVPREARGVADVVAREPGVIAGIPAAQIVLDLMKADITWTDQARDGDGVGAGTVIANMSGSARDILTCERIILNLIGRLSGVATLTRSYSDAIASTKARVLDTRKTTPGWRRLEKYAVHYGGGVNHRFGLYDGVLIKDNHLAFGSDLDAKHQFTPDEAIATVRERLAVMVPKLREQMGPSSGAPLDVDEIVVGLEVDTLQQLEVVLPASPDYVLLDNMTLDQLRQAVAMRDAVDTNVELEASGGVNLDTIADIAATGVDRISVGALTHSATSLDIALDWR